MPLFPYNPGSTHSSVLDGIRDPDDRSAWERFFGQYAPWLRALALRRGLRPADAEDAVQTVLSEVAAKAPSFAYDRARGRFRDWLAGAALYRIRDLQRQNARRAARELPLAEDAPDPAAPGDAFAAMAEEEWLAHVRRLALERLRSQVSRAQFELFHAAAVEEWPAANVAQTYGVSRAAVYQAKHRLMPLWRDALRAVQADLDAPPPAAP
ncbi:MAG: sigma-70 family RNA polymerase sigma factor [Kiritimatiellae bacterium]|nr:sigma-70 family RNA polymerase sigma factor [Kiritimatiellia bacterium]